MDWTPEQPRYKIEVVQLRCTGRMVDDGEFIEAAALEHSEIRKIWADGGYNGRVIEELQERTGIDIEVVKRTDDMSGFVVLPRRWVVERTFGWMERCRLLNREYERTVSSSTADVFHAMCMVMGRRLASKVDHDGNVA